MLKMDIYLYDTTKGQKNTLVIVLGIQSASLSEKTLNGQSLIGTLLTVIYFFIFLKYQHEISLNNRKINNIA